MPQFNRIPHESGLMLSTHRGEEVTRIIDDLVRLRMTIFHDWPYLYEADEISEMRYLTPYIESENAFVCAMHDSEKVVGATTAIPLCDMNEEIQQPFIEAGMNPAEWCYFGESLLLSDYRGLGIGSYYFAVREAYAVGIDLKKFCFCSVVREDDHPMRPSNERLHNIFWRKHGYRCDKNLLAYLTWRDIGVDHETIKPLEFWLKES